MAYTVEPGSFIGGRPSDPTERAAWEEQIRSNLGILDQYSQEEAARPAAELAAMPNLTQNRSSTGLYGRQQQQLNNAQRTANRTNVYGDVLGNRNASRTLAQGKLDPMSAIGQGVMNSAADQSAKTRLGTGEQLAGIYGNLSSQQAATDQMMAQSAPSSAIRNLMLSTAASGGDVSNVLGNAVDPRTGAVYEPFQDVDQGTALRQYLMTAGGYTEEEATDAIRRMFENQISGLDPNTPDSMSIADYIGGSGSSVGSVIGAGLGGAAIGPSGGFIGSYLGSKL